MALLPSIASPVASNLADLFTKPLSLSRHRFTTTTLIGDESTTPTTSVVAPTVGASASTAVASASAPTATTVSDSVPNLHLHPTLTLPTLDTGDSVSLSPSRSDFTLEVSQAPYGLIRSAFDTSVASDSKVYPKPASTVDPYTQITGEDTAISVDLSSPDTIDFDSDSGPSFTKITFAIRDFGTATLTFIYSKSTSELLHIFVDPTQIDWLHWVPLPRLILPESYFHIFGLDYLQAFALFHLIPIWIALVSALLRSE